MHSSHLPVADFRARYAGCLRHPSARILSSLIFFWDLSASISFILRLWNTLKTGGLWTCLPRKRLVFLEYTGRVQMRVSEQLSQILMSRYKCNLWNWHAHLEEPWDCFVSQIMESQISYICFLSCSVPRKTKAVCGYGKYVLTLSMQCFEDLNAI